MATNAQNPSIASELARHFVEFACETYPRNPRLRRSIPWLILLLLGIESLADGSLRLHCTKQMKFLYRNYWFKVRFKRRALKEGGKDCGGWEILTLLEGQ